MAVGHSGAMATRTRSSGAGLAARRGETASGTGGPLRVRVKATRSAAGRARRLLVVADYVIKGRGTLKLATGESSILGRDADDSDFVVRSGNGEPNQHYVCAFSWSAKVATADLCC